MWAINVNLKSEAPKADNIVVDIVVVVVVIVVVVIVVVVVIAVVDPRNLPLKFGSNQVSNSGWWVCEVIFVGLAELCLWLG